MASARALSQSFEGLKDRDQPDRLLFGTMLQNVLEKNPEFLSAWTCWEPNALDGKDKDFAGAPGHDAQGRFAPLWTRLGGTIDLQALENVTEPGAGDYYLLPRNSGIETVTPPFEEKTGDKRILVTSLSVPMKHQGTVVGVTGINIPLEALQKSVTALKPLGTGWASLIGNDGRYIATADLAQINKDLGTGADESAMKAAIRSGNVHTGTRRLASRDGMEVYTAVVPISVGKSPTPWALMVDVPMDTVTAGARQMRDTILLIALVGMLLVSAMVYYLTRNQVTRPLGHTVHMIQEMARGHYGVRLKMAREDEVGTLASTMDGFADSLQNEVVGTLHRLAKGDVSMDVVAKDDQDEMAPALNRTITSLRGLVEEANALTRAAVAGRLDARGHAERFEGGYRQILEGVNGTLEAVIAPLTAVSEQVERLGRGIIPERITADWQGDFNRLKESLNSCVDGLGGLVESNAVLQRMAMNDLQATVNGSYQGVFAEVARAVNDVREGLESLQVTAVHLAAGDLTDLERFRAMGDNKGRRSENDRLVPSFIAMMDAIQALVADADNLTKAAAAGRLASRADASRHKGEYGKVVGGLNAALDAVITPLNVAAEYVDRIGKGDLPPAIVETWHGDFNEVKTNLNACIDNIQSLIAEADTLARAAVDGRLTVRADASRQPGEFRHIVEGMNRTMDSLVGHLDAMPAPAFIVDRDLTVRYFNAAAAAISGVSAQAAVGTKCYDHFRTAQCRSNACATGQCIAQGRAVTSETEAQPQGRRHDISYTGVPLHGADGKIIGALEVITDLTAVKAAARVAAKQAGYQAQEVEKLLGILGQVSQGNLAVTLGVAPTDADTREIGDNFSRVHRGVEQTVAAVAALVTDADSLARSAVEGRLSIRADASRHQGDFRKVIDGVNRTLGAVVEPLQESARVLEAVARQDLRATVQGNYAGDHAAIKTSINTMVGDLRGSIGKIAEDARALGSSAQGLGSVSLQMSANAEETSTQVERRLGGLRAGVAQPHRGRDQLGGNARLGARDRQERERGGAHGEERRRGGRYHQPDRPEAGRLARPRSATSSRSSPRSPSRPTCSPSTRPSRRPGPGMPARASRWWPTRSRSWPRRPRRRPRTSAGRSPPSRATRPARSRPSARSARSSRRSTTCRPPSPRRSKSRRPPPTRSAGTSAKRRAGRPRSRRTSPRWPTRLRRRPRGRPTCRCPPRRSARWPGSSRRWSAGSRCRRLKSGRRLPIEPEDVC